MNTSDATVIASFNLAGRFDYAIAFVFLLLVSLTAPPFSSPNELYSEDGLALGMSLCMYVIILCIGIRSFMSGFAPGVAQVWLFHLAMLWFCVTIALSPYQIYNYDKLLQTYIYSIAAFLIGYAVRAERVLLVLLAVGTCLACLSIIAGLAVPELAIHQPGYETAVVGDWRGVFFHKNHAAAVMGACLIIAIHELRIRRTVWLYGVTSVIVAFLLLSGGKNATLAALASICIYFLPSIFSKKSWATLLWLVCAYGMLMAAIILIYLAWDTVGLSSDALTGRGEIWLALGHIYSSYPIMGGGYGALFDDSGSRSVISQYLGSSWTIYPTHGHNAYLELLASTGVIGAALIVAVLANIFITISRSPVGVNRRIFIALFTFVLIHNAFEAGIFDRKRFTWMLLVMIYGAATNSLRSGRAETPHYGAGLNAA